VRLEEAGDEEAERAREGGDAQRNRLHLELHDRVAQKLDCLRVEGGREGRGGVWEVRARGADSRVLLSVVQTLSKQMGRFQRADATR
jgi:signal transduction histidine kinase